MWRATCENEKLVKGKLARSAVAKGAQESGKGVAHANLPYSHQNLC